VLAAGMLPPSLQGCIYGALGNCSCVALLHAIPGVMRSECPVPTSVGSRLLTHSPWKNMILTVKLCSL
ncbi:hypothetical protein, partial [Methylocucumis oryzae]|uniref:hypothetical protein n=1 Tax=Methylocucumis oryzae TaxID=1632867 RepID=UPI00195548BB